MNWQGKWEWGTGFIDKGETKKIAYELAKEADEIRRGIRPAPNGNDDEILKPIQEHIDAYFAWGDSAGGRGGRPWSPQHSRKCHADIGGHQRLKVLKEKGLNEVEVVVVDLDQSKERALNVSLNNCHIAGDWTEDIRQLLDELEKEDEELFSDLGLDSLLREAKYKSGFENIKRESLSKKSRLMLPILIPLNIFGDTLKNIAWLTFASIPLINYCPI